MKKNNFFNRKAKAILGTTFLASIVLTGNVFATSSELKIETSEAYEIWSNFTEEQKSQSVMPRAYDVEIPDSILSEYEYEYNGMPKVLNQLLGKTSNPFSNVGNAKDSRFNLAEELNLRVEHQGTTTECWAFSLLKSVETSQALQEGNKDIGNLSERHMDYATSRTFLDGINEAGFDREVGKGGLFVVGLAYLTNGQGAVLESDMPFADEETRINLREIDKDVDTIVNDYYTLPTIHKEYEKDSKGNTLSVKYKKANGVEYKDNELKAVRNIIKTHLVENGAIASMTGGNYAEFYNNAILQESTAYNCNVSNNIRDHAITIVGWDDNYPKENFGEGKMPSTDGAYIVLNTYGTEVFDEGYMYISYEDFFIEEELYGIVSTGKVDYENIYQHDYYGGIYKIGLNTQSTGSIATIYDRDETKNEKLTSVGVTLSDYANVEIYVNPNGSSLSSYELIKVGETTEALTPGFHRVDITPTKLTGQSFAVVVKQISENSGFYFQLEANVANTAYGLVDSENKSYFSLNGSTWSNITNLNVAGIDMSKADVCIKAYTINSDDELTEEPEENDPEIKEPENDNPEETKIEVTSNEYTIKDGYIMNIEYNTNKKDFLDNIKVNSGKNVINSDGSAVKDDDVIKTGMKLRLSDGSIYILVVRGDINMDGRVSLTDLSKLILHYNEVKGFELDGDSLKGADMNVDGVVNLVDVSQLLVLYNSI